MEMKQGVCEAPMRYSAHCCALRAGHRGAHELSDGTEYFTSEFDSMDRYNVRREVTMPPYRPDPARPITTDGVREAIGPVYTTRALSALWGVTEATVGSRAKAGKVLRIKVQGKNLFPVFQFHGQHVRRDVLGVVDELRRCAVDPFTIAQWLQSPLADDPDDGTPLALLKAGRRAEALSAARRAAARWTA